MDMYAVNDRPDLPDEAGNHELMPFEPNDKWLSEASKEEQIEAMRRWFYARYEDPANCTPYDGREGGYQFVYGGPFDPDEEIQERFSKFVEFDVMKELIDELYQEAGDEWAPVDHDINEWEYGEALSLFEDEGTPFRMLLEKLEQVKEVLTAHGSPHIQALVTQLAYGAAIAALEAYLLEVASWRALSSDESLRSFVEKNTDPKLGGGSLKLSEIFGQMDGLKKKVFAYLQTYVWHRLDDVKEIFEKGFGIEFPKTSELKGDILLRHDIVHRGGKNKEGNAVTVSAEDVRKVLDRIQAFGKALESEFDRVIPSKF
ncbi:hypothetical protein [Pseudomonas sp. NFACC45]|uniref:hypothetical protein n=1 Tax=Pseudomonas sp. NFACC45 TaxID=1566201 RepID=UPI0008E1386A|nr:hypothetical protein [Pseudomonas sp. NFACC45]SFH12771.1 hypothetical protein SAMN03159297_03215 [Pseudomonas sp. NFACC45]